MTGEKDRSSPPLSRDIFRRVTYVGMQKPNWGRHSGANGIMDVTPARSLTLPRTTGGLAAFAMWRAAKLIKEGKNFWYSPDAMRLEAKVALDWRRRSGHIYHFLSGESEYLLSGRLKKYRENTIICTYHLPLSRLPSIIHRPDDIQRTDAAIVVSTNLVDFFRDLLGHGNVWHVPLGVDTAFWSPPEKERGGDGRKKRILFVGAHLRDFETLRKVVKTVRGESEGVEFDLLLSGHDRLIARGLEGATVHSGIDDLALLDLYRGSDLLVCPLIDCTASCTIVEALACGLPMVVTDIGGVRDYVNGECAVLTPPGDASAMAGALLALLASPERGATMSRAARERALELDWVEVARQMEVIYRKFLGEKPPEG